MRRAIYLFAAATLFAGSPPLSPLTAQPPAQKPKLDLHGDPLPAGASLRLGSIAFRNRIEAPSLAFRPDGKAVAVPDGDHIKVWELATGRVVQVFRIDPPAKDSEWRYAKLAYSPDGSVLLASVGIRAPDGEWFAPNRIVIWDAASGRFQRFLIRPDADVQCFSFYGDNRTIVLQEDQRIAVRDIVTGVQASKASVSFDIDETPSCLAYVREID